MSDQENKRLFEHYTNVANGNVKSGNPVRDDLIVSDAKRHLADLIKKNPSLVVEETKPILPAQKSPPQMATVVKVKLLRL